MIALFVLLVLAAAAAGAAARAYLTPHTGHHTAEWFESHGITTVPARVLNVGEWR